MAKTMTMMRICIIQQLIKQFLIIAVLCLLRITVKLIKHL